MKGSTPLGPIVGIIVIVVLLLIGAVYSLRTEVERLKNPPQATSTTITVRLPTTTIIATSTATSTTSTTSTRD